jgi:hypothetical protein
MQNVSPGAKYIGKALDELQVNVTKETTVQELYGIYNGIFALALDLLIEDIKNDNLT